MSLVIVSLLVPLAWPESNWVSEVMSIKTLSQLQKFEKNRNERSISLLACEIELKTGQVPTSCYEAKPQSPKTLKILDDLCIKASDGLRVPPKVSPSLSRKCHVAIKNAQDILDYRANDGASFD